MDWANLQFFGYMVIQEIMDRNCTKPQYIQKYCSCQNLCSKLFSHVFSFQRVPKREDKWNRPGEKGISGKCASPVVDDCSNIQKVECSLPRIAFFLKSTLTCVSAVSNSDVNLRWPLRPNRFPVCQFAFHMEHRSTKYHRQEKHHCNSVWLAQLLRFFPAPHPNSKRSKYPDLRLSERRFRFFLANKGVQFIQLSLFDLR